MAEHMTFAKFGGTAEQYIREYLDPDNTLASPTTEDEARAMWADMEETVAADGGTGIDEDTFVAAVKGMQLPTEEE